MKSSQILFVGALAFVSGAASAQAQTTYNYIGTTGGTWSTPGNWSPSGPPSTSSDTADLNNVTATQNVLYDTGASGVLGTLNITETSAFVNSLTLQRTLTLTNSLTLGASGGGTAELATGTSAGNFALSVGTGTISVNSGGLLLFGAGAATTTAAGVTIASGGTLTTTGASSTTAGTTISGTLTINSGGTLNVGSLSSLNVTGNFTMNGTATNTANFGSANATTGLNLSGATNVIAPTNAATFANVVLTGGNTSTTAQFGNLTVRAYNTNTATFSSSYASTTAAQINGNINLQDQTRNSGLNTFKLGSNLSSSGTLGVANFALTTQGSGGSLKFGIDTNSYTLDFSTFGSTTTPLAFKPVDGENNSTTVPTLYTLTDSSNTTGKILAPSFVLNSASSGVAVTGTITLQATGGNSSANTLSTLNGQTIAATSTFLYSGAAATTAPATLTSSRAIGNLAVQNGSLQLLSAITAAGASVVVNSGGTLDVNANALTATAGALTLADATGAGTIRNSSSTAATVSAASMTFNPGGMLTYSLSTTANSTNLLVALTGALTQGTAGTGNYNIALTGGLAGQTYELASFGSTNFAAGTSFTEVGSVSGSFSIGIVNGVDQLDFTVAAVPEPSTWISGLMCVGLASLVAHKRMRHTA